MLAKRKINVNYVDPGLKKCPSVLLQIPPSRYKRLEPHMLTTPELARKDTSK